VLVNAGTDAIERWLPFECDAGQLEDEIATKTIFPTTLPQDIADLMVEQAVAREALRLAYEQHKEVAAGPPREVSGKKRLTMSQDQMLKVMTGTVQKPWHSIGLLVGSGGVISHAPARQQAALMMLDAFVPEGVVELVVDSVFMLPHLGVLSTLWPEIAQDVLVSDCLIPLGTAVCLTGSFHRGESAVSISGTTSSGRSIGSTVRWGDIHAFELRGGEQAQIRVSPVSAVDGGRGPGRAYDLEVSGGEAGFIVDARGRPLDFSGVTRHEAVASWMKAIRAFEPADITCACRSFGGGGAC
jgi:hypothetical protein